jgi:hypothetical protein
MRTYLKLVLTATLTVLATAAVAENPFAGTWKFDASKSKITGHAVTFIAESAGRIQVTEGGQSYSFKPDGSASKTSLTAHAAARVGLTNAGDRGISSRTLPPLRCMPHWVD